MKLITYPSPAIDSHLTLDGVRHASGVLFTSKISALELIISFIIFLK